MIIAGSGAAIAQETAEEGWQANSWKRQITYNGGKARDLTYDLYTLHTTATDKPGLMFSCSEEYGMNVLYSFDAVDLLSLFTEPQQSRRLRSIPMWVWTGNYRNDSAYYMVRRSDKVLANQKPIQSAIAMGAILQGLPIRIKSGGYFDVTLPLPPLDEEVMAFVENCEKASEIADEVKAATASRAAAD
ncbi:hypothetical protein [Henriciella barbarensis]|nr:hypothetical protein [Henriciella barbarensis]